MEIVFEQARPLIFGRARAVDRYLTFPLSHRCAVPSPEKSCQLNRSLQHPPDSIVLFQGRVFRSVGDMPDLLPRRESM
jgi:hypothetical protein